MKIHTILVVLFCLLSFSHAQIIKDTANIARKDTIKSIYNPFKKEIIYLKQYADTNGIAKDASLNKVQLSPSYKLETKLEINSESEIKNLYIIRFAADDKENNINFYGLSIGLIHMNQAATFSGLAINVGMGNPPIQGKPNEDISVNGINFSFFVAGITGTINGFSFGGLWGNQAGVVNGCALGILGTESEILNGLAVGGLASASKFANAIQVSGIMNAYCKFNGIGLAAYNREYPDLCERDDINGLILGIYNNLSVNGLSIGLVNNGNSWLQIGLVNMGDSTVQIGLFNLDENKKMTIPLLNVNF